MKETWADRLWLHPGAARAISGQRPAAARLALGRPADDLPALMGALYALCARAQWLTARRAVAAARGEVDAFTRADAQALRWATARDQVFKLAHELPVRLGEPEAVLTATLTRCPLRGDSAATDDTFAAWLGEVWLGMPLSHWLGRLDDEGMTWIGRWCRGAGTPLAAWLARIRPRAQGIVAPASPWRPLDEAGGALTRLAAAWTEGADAFDGAAAVPETGPWTRYHDEQREPANDAWIRIASRVADLARLATPGGETWLAHGVRATASGEALAWTETARGLLMHWVALDRAGCVRDIRVLAPTDLNFHPRGVLARSVAALRGPLAQADARVLAAAFDPCVEFGVAAAVEEAVYA